MTREWKSLQGGGVSLNTPFLKRFYSILFYTILFYIRSAEIVDDCHDNCGAFCQQKVELQQLEQAQQWGDTIPESDDKKIYRDKTENKELYHLLEGVLANFTGLVQLRQVGHGFDTNVNKSLWTMLLHGWHQRIKHIVVAVLFHWRTVLLLPLGLTHLAIQTTLPGCFMP